MSLWSWVYQEIYYFRAFAILFCYRHLQIIIAITHLYSIMDRATEVLKLLGLFQSWGKSKLLFFFRFRSKMSGLFICFYFLARKWNCFFRYFFIFRPTKENPFTVGLYCEPIHSHAVRCHTVCDATTVFTMVCYSSVVDSSEQLWTFFHLISLHVQLSHCSAH